MYFVSDILEQFHIHVKFEYITSAKANAIYNSENSKKVFTAEKLVEGSKMACVRCAKSTQWESCE